MPLGTRSTVISEAQSEAARRMRSLESEARARSAADQIIGGMKMGKTPEQSAADLIYMGVAQDLVEAGLARVRQRAEESRILRIPESLVDPDHLPRPWYPGVTPGDRFWPALQEEFRRAGLPSTAIDSIDNASRKIVGLLAPPWEPKIDTRGLVLGYVQSGKTSNFTAVMAKAADFGYRLFIVITVKTCRGEESPCAGIAPSGPKGDTK
jgi:hypothetical protein